MEPPGIFFKTRSHAETCFPFNGHDECVPVFKQSGQRHVQHGEAHAAGDVHSHGIGNDRISYRQHSADGQAVAGVRVGHERAARRRRNTAGVFHLADSLFLHILVSPLSPRRGRFAGSKVRTVGKKFHEQAGQRAEMLMVEHGFRSGGQCADRVAYVFMRSFIASAAVRAACLKGVCKLQGQGHQPGIVGQAQPVQFFCRNHMFHSFLRDADVSGISAGIGQNQRSVTSVFRPFTGWSSGLRLVNSEATFRQARQCGVRVSVTKLPPPASARGTTS